MLRIYLLLIALVAGLLTACGGGGATSGSDNTSVNGGPQTQVTLRQIQVSLFQQELITGLTTQAFAAGIYSDSRAQDLSSWVQWLSSDSNVATVDQNGVITSLHSGSTVISATLEGESASIELLVEDAALVALSITPSNLDLVAGMSQQLSVKGLFNNDSDFVVTDQVSWQSSDSSVLSISSDGVLTANAVGSATVTATLGDISSSLTFDVSNATLSRIEISATDYSLPAGRELQLFASGIFSDNSVVDLTDKGTWQSVDESVLTVASSGQVTGISSGSGLVSLSYLGQSASQIINVDEAVMVTLEVSPIVSSLAKGHELQLKASAVYSDDSVVDVTNSATWISADENVATVSNATWNHGRVVGAAVGQTTITAHIDDLSQTAAIVVTPASLQSLEVSPTNPTMAVGTSQSFSVIAHYDDGSSRSVDDDVSWSTSTAGVLSQNGDSNLFDAVAIGDTQLIASLEGVVTFAKVSVTAAQLDSIILSSAQSELAVGYEMPMVATGHFSDGSEQDISGDVLWQSLDTNVASVSNALGRQGIVSALQQGVTTIRVDKGTVSATAAITVTDAVLDGITVQKQISNMVVGFQQQLTATGHYSDGATLDITDAVVWHSGNSDVAVVSNGAGEQGMVTALSGGSVVITAAIGSVEGGITLNTDDNPNTPISVSMAAVPNTILNNGVDTTQLTITLQPAHSDGQIADNTEITVLVSEGSNSYSQTLSTLNGSASVALSSTYSGFIQIDVSLANDVTGTGYIYAIDSIDQAIAAALSKSAQYDGNTLLANSQFTFLVRNLSNRNFEVIQYKFSNGSNSKIYPGADISGGVLTAGEQNSITVVLADNQLDGGLSGILTLKDVITAQTFELSVTFTSP